jgi:hypothetical protein
MISAMSCADDEVRCLGEDFKIRKRKFFERLAAKGYRNVPLSEISAARREELYSEIKKEYGYDPASASIRAPADEENCFFTFRGSRLSAFCFGLRPSPTQMIFDFGGASAGEKYSGAFLMPLSAYITKTYSYPSEQTVVYLFHEDNMEMINLANHTLSGVIRSTRYKANYVCYPRGSSNDLAVE